MAKRQRIRARRIAMVTKPHECKGGPWKGATIYLDAYCDGNTGWLEINGRIGRYRSGKWEPMPATHFEPIAEAA